MSHGIRVTHVKPDGEFEAEIDTGPLYEQVRQLLGLPWNYRYTIAIEGTYNVENLADGSIVPYCTSAYAVHPRPDNEVEINLSQHIQLESLDAKLEKSAGNDLYVNWVAQLENVADADWRDDR